jgi:hypothetical protein
MSGRFGPRIAVVAAILTLVTAVIGFVASLILNAFVLDKYNAYGEVAIPGSTSLHLPAGETTVSFHTVLTGRPGGGGLPVPNLHLTMVAPGGLAEPQITGSYGSTTTVNNDSHVRVWVVQIAAEGTYDIVADGDVNGYISPRLAFGHGSSYGWLVWVFVGLFVVGLLDLFASLFWSARSGKRARPLAPYELLTSAEPTWSSGVSSTPSYPPTDQGVRLEQLKTLTALRDSGALTVAEFDAEKRRILNG